MTSILDSIKKLLGISDDDTQFDTDIIIHINTVFSILTQLGVGPEEGFSISDKTTTWSDFIDNATDIEMVKTYVYLRVRLLFDPPQSSFAIEAIKESFKEIEYRMYVLKDNERISEGDGN